MGMIYGFLDWADRDLSIGIPFELGDEYLWLSVCETGPRRVILNSKAPPPQFVSVSGLAVGPGTWPLVPGVHLSLYARGKSATLVFAVPIETMSSPGKRGPRSVLDYLFQDHGDGHFACVFCEQTLKSRNGRRHGGNAWHHLRTVHYDLLKLLLEQAPSRLASNKDLEVHLTLGSPGAAHGEYSADLDGSTLTVTKVVDPSAPVKKRGITAFVVPQHEIEAAKRATFGVEVKNALVRYVCATGQPFNVVQSPSFRRFCETLLPTYSALRLKSRGVIVRGMIEMVDSVKQETRSLLRASPVVALSSDMWSSVRSYLPLMSIGGYFLRDGLVDFRVLDLRCPDGGDAHALAQEIDGVISMYNIQNKVASLTTDGEPKMKNIVAESDYLHIHNTCLAHSLVLCVKHVMMKNGETHTPVSHVVGRMERLIRFFHDSSTATHRLQQLQVASTEQIYQILDDLGLGRDWDEGEIDRLVEATEDLEDDVEDDPDEEGIVFVEEEDVASDEEDHSGDDDGGHDEEEEEINPPRGTGGGTVASNATMSISSSDDEGGEGEATLSALRSTALRVLDLTQEHEREREHAQESGPPTGRSPSGSGEGRRAGEGGTAEEGRRKGLRLLRPCPTRWTSRLRAIIRFLLLWPYVRVIVHAANKKRSSRKKLPVLSQSEITLLQMIIVLLTPMYGLVVHLQTMAPQAAKAKRLLSKLLQFYEDPTGEVRKAKKREEFRIRSGISMEGRGTQRRRPVSNQQLALKAFQGLTRPGRDGDRMRHLVCNVPAQRELMARVLEAIERSNDRLLVPPAPMVYQLRSDVRLPFSNWSTTAPQELMKLIKTHILGQGLMSFGSSGTSGASQTLSLRSFLDTDRTRDKSYGTIQMASFFNIVTESRSSMDEAGQRTVTLEVRKGDSDVQTILFDYMLSRIRERVEEDAGKLFPLPQEQGTQQRATESGSGEEEDAREEGSLLEHDDSVGGKRGREDGQALPSVSEVGPQRKKGPGFLGCAYGDVSDDEGYLEDYDMEETMRDANGGEGSSSTFGQGTIFTGAAHATQFEDEVAAAERQQHDYVTATMNGHINEVNDALEYFASSGTREVVRDPI